MGNVRELLSGYDSYDFNGKDVLYYNENYTENGLPIGMVEVNDNIKGDVARILLYVYVRWGEPNLFENDPSPYKPSNDEKNDGYKVIEDLETLLQWCKMDPVDTWEMARNDSIQGVQGNRNVFIDYPEFAWLLFGQEVPADMPTPSGNGSNNYEINAISSNTSYGTVSLTGHTITAYPKEGYYAAGYTVLSGTATVTQDGNTFVVKPETGCTICINFAAKTVVTVDFNGAAEAVNGYAGDAIILPTAADYETYTFLGWVDAPIADTTVKPTFYAPGASYTPTQSQTLYPLYQYSVGGAGSGKWMRVTSSDELVVGSEVIIACTEVGKAAGNLSSAYLSIVDATFSENDGILNQPSEDVAVFTLGGKAGAWTLIGADGQALGATAVKKLAWNSGSMTWDISVEGGNVIITNTTASYGTMYYNNNNPRFTTYVSVANMVLPQLYKLDGSSGEQHYTTELTKCDHGTSTFHKAVAATCTTAGNVAYYSCNSCGSLFSDAACTNPVSQASTVIAALGHKAGTYKYDAANHWHLCATCGVAMDDREAHSWNEGTVTVNPTETQAGVRVYTCTLCAASKNETIPALGDKLTLSFIVPAGFTAPTALSGYHGDKVTLPDFSQVPVEGYAFVGWTSETLDNSTTAGIYYPAGQSYTLSGNESLRALYSYQKEGEEDSDAWTLLTSDSDLKVGMELILASNAKGTTAGSISSSVLTKVASDFSGDMKTLETIGDGTLVFTLGGEAGAWTLSNADGRLLGATAVKKLGWDAGTTTWNITVSDGTATIYNTNSAYGRFLYNVNSPRFTTYTSATSATMLLPQLYTKSGKAMVTYYTSAYAVAPTEPVLDETIAIYHTLDLANDISVTFAVLKSALEGYDSYYLECVLPEYEGNALVGSSTLRIEPVVSGNYYYFTLTGMTAVRMGDMVEAVLHMTKGGAEYISKTDEYSVATYAYTMLNSGKAGAIMTLCADLLRYGAEAQSFKGYRTDALVDSAMTAMHRSYLSDTTAVSFTATDSYLGDLASPVITWVGKTLDLGSKVGMKFVFNAKNYTGDLAKLSMKVTYQGGNGETKTVTLTGAEVYHAENKQYSFTFYGLLAAELRTVVEVAIYEGNTQRSETLRYSAESYGAKTVGTVVETLTRALFAYSDSAKAYFAK